MSPTEPTKVTPRLLRDWSLPEPGSSKHLRGRVVLLGGSARTPGAVQLSGIATLRVGAGHLSLAVAAPASVGLAVATPEAGVAGLAWTRPARCCRTASRRCRSRWVRPTRSCWARVWTRPRWCPVSWRARFVCWAPTPAWCSSLSPWGALAELPALPDDLAARTVLTPNDEEAGRLLGRSLGSEPLPE